MLQNLRNLFASIPRTVLALGIAGVIFGILVVGLIFLNNQGKPAGNQTSSQNSQTTGTAEQFTEAQKLKKLSDVAVSDTQTIFAVSSSGSVAFVDKDGSLALNQK